MGQEPSLTHGLCTVGLRHGHITGTFCAQSKAVALSKLLSWNSLVFDGKPQLPTLSSYKQYPARLPQVTLREGHPLLLACQCERECTLLVKPLRVCLCQNLGTPGQGHP